MVGDSNLNEGARINGKTLSEWDGEWKIMDGGFSQEHPRLHGFIGLIRADLNQEIKVIAAATEFDKGGFTKKLQTTRSTIVQSGNDYPATNYIRENIDSLTLKVLVVGKGAGLELITRDLKEAMMKKYGLKRGKIGKQQ